MLVDKIVERLGGDLAGRTFALWGLAFKPNTDDMREAPSRVVIEALAARGARVVAYDPVAMDEARRIFGDAPHVCVREVADRRVRRRRRARRGHRVEGIPQPRLRRRCGSACARRSCSTAATCIAPAELVRAAGLEYFGDRTTMSASQRPRFSTLRDAAAAARVLVVGDVMLDRYWFGEVERISPEAPVPVVKIARTEERPGGAANVARNVAALGAQAHAPFRRRRRRAGRRARRSSSPASACRRRSCAMPTLPTTVKLRVIGRQQQLLRIDFETAPSHEVLAAKLADYERLMADADVVVLSDYGKGGLAHIATMIERARAAGKRVLVDPKGDDYARYRGATLLTPNRGELREVVGRWKDEADLAAKAQSAARATSDLEALLVTRSEEGMSLFTDEGALTIPAQAREVYDVSGAGDTVIATLGVLLAAGASLPDRGAHRQRGGGRGRRQARHRGRAPARTELNAR